MSPYRGPVPTRHSPSHCRDRQESPAVHRVRTDKLMDLTLMDRTMERRRVVDGDWLHVGAKEIPRDDTNVIHIFFPLILFYLFI